MNQIFCLLSTMAFASAVLTAGEWKVDPAHSTAAFAVRHMMVSIVHGSFSDVKGTVSYEPGKLTEAKANLTIGTASITTANENRDKDLKSSNFFDVEKYPTITFVSKKVIPGAAGKFQLLGDLTMHGVTKEVTFDVSGPESPVKDGRGNLHTGASATARVNRKDFGLTWNKAIEGGGVMVGEEVDLTVEVELIQPKAS